MDDSPQNFHVKDKVDTILGRLHSLADPERAAHAHRYFKSGPGQYGEGDRFLGIRVPQLRALAREFRETPLEEVLRLLQSPWHEARFTALVILTEQFRRAKSEAARRRIFEAYLDHTAYINNWDLVDCSAHKIVGPWLEKRSRRPLCKLAKSSLLWDRRIAVISTFHLIRLEDFDDCLALAELLLNDSEDLMHKAVGWMLREVGNRDRAVLESFLDRHAVEMPRTMLRYAIEKLPEMRRRYYLNSGR